MGLRLLYIIIFFSAGIDFRLQNLTSTVDPRTERVKTFLNRPTQQTQNICIKFVQCWANVEDVGPTLYILIMFLTNVLKNPTK